MSNQPRVVKVLAALLASMTIGAIVLMAMGHNPPAAGAWSLSRSLRSDSVELAVNSSAVQLPARWNRVEVCYSGTDSGNIEQLAKLSGIRNPKDINCHFVVCNGEGGYDGQLQTTEKWLRQYSITPSSGWLGSSSTIRVCVVSDGIRTQPSEIQKRKVQALLAELSNRFRINVPVLFPKSWTN